MDDSLHLYRSQPLRCTIIGAGVSGLLMAYKLRKHLKGYVHFNIYEKNSELGGTWHENTYPGCACDVPSHCYQYPFAPNPAWSKFYASSKEIKSYLEGVAKHFDLEHFIHYSSRVVSAQWLEEPGIWTVQVENGPSVESEILVNASGILNHPQLPDIEGLSNFAGPLLHTASWDSSVDLKGKRVAVIGSGASAVQLLPEIQPLSSQVHVFIRTPSWITRPLGMPIPDATNYTYKENEKDGFRLNEEAYLKIRKSFEADSNGQFRAFFKGSTEQEDVRAKFETRMKTLIHDEDLQRKLIPSFEAGCRRINPGEQFLVALQQPNVQPVFDRIDKITPHGVVAAVTEYPADILVAATGFNTSFRPRFPIIGRNNVNLQDIWAEEPVSYWGTGVAGFPNYLIFLGPNTPISNGSLMGSLEATGDYFVRLIRKMIRQHVKAFDVRPDAQQDFDRHTQSYMQNMVWTGTCRSWYKKGVDGRVSALWPGSSLHYIQALAENRWEDYQWGYEGERYEYWRHGLSWIEDPETDPLGLDEQESLRTCSTIPKKDSDLAFYIRKSPPLPHSSIPNLKEEEREAACGSNVSVSLATEAVDGHIENTVNQLIDDTLSGKAAETQRNVPAGVVITVPV
ncbi:Monooxygenase [Pleurostoma richardsiae]|uniref:Monooxygenase n=1 Tax=Pleurostoma richardsiae TaxID=41990 RepID=A0AA38VPQ2_9PEZI|nr:Monooxygenase [Pleurostoma richardsiae]